jgi:tetratricopeptide (TPR) repeat protein
MLQNTDAALPPWLVEGFAEFYSTAQFERNGEVRLGTPANHRVAGLYLLDKPRMETLLGSGTENMTSEQVEAFYGWSWVLTHYLAFADERRGQLVKYIAAIQSGVDPMRAANDAFGDLKKLGQDMDRYLHVNRFQFLAVKAPGSDAIAVAVRPLRPGEAAAMPARIRSARGVSRKNAPPIAAVIRTVASNFPTDPTVQTWLAEAEFDTGNYAAAEAAADRALALDPKIEKALIYKGRARRESMESTAKGNWNAIRDLFMKANRLDVEDAEPLSLYYESYLRAGQEPTANAVAGLKYALVLAPQDPSLRMMTVRELINQKQFSEARADLAPLAFNPHSSKGRAQARKVMDALSANDPKTALAALENSAAEDDGN